MPAEHIAFFYSAVTRAGLKAFHPDVFGPTHSTYNLLHRHLAVSTFRTIAGWYGYTALNVSLTVTEDYHLLSEMYDNFMFGTIKTNSHKENNSPGSLSKALNTSKDGRSKIVTSFFRELDSSILKQSKRNPNRNKKFLPVGVPIDFWTPKFYNEDLDIQEKAMYVNTGVAFRLGKFCNDQDAAKWSKMPAKEFMKIYGNEVLAQYNLPTPEEIAALGMDKDCDEGSDADDESTDLEDTDDDEAMEEEE
ncbi:hypothetical protein B0H19DRAFT_1344934 [Mycena capillaripes]|nr:hypothetical protein B0H19DRAFT_1344934 [Mycena capillaripes]